MKKPFIKMLFSLLIIVAFVGLSYSCDSDNEQIDRTCKVTFLTNLTNAGTDTTCVYVEAGELCDSVPELTRTGYKFDGWYTNSADANPIPEKNIKAPKFPVYDLTSRPVYLDMILYARWIK